MMFCRCGGCGAETSRPAVEITRVNGMGGGGIKAGPNRPDHLCEECARFIYEALAARRTKGGV